MKILEDLKIKSVELKGEKCIRVMDFARVTNKSQSHISNLIGKGNKVRKLRCVRLLGAPFIPVSEIVLYPFTTVGRNCQVYYYKEDGTTTYITPTKRGVKV